MNEKLTINRNLHRLRFYALFVIMLHLFAVSANAIDSSQPKKVVVTGVVNDSKNLPLINVSVLEKGTSNGVLTDDNGKFSITLTTENPVIQVMYIGFETQEITVGGTTQFTITMREEVNALDESVVIGYGTQRKGDVTSSIASIKAEDFNPGNIANAAELVKGRVAGLYISRGSGDPNVKSSISLRGISSLFGSTQPLVLVDGIPGDMNSVAPENIESIDVLKDASAAAIYGTRGANGIIIITTKNGKRGQFAKTTYSGYVAASNFYKTADFMDASDIRRLIAEGVKLTNFTDEKADTDWVDAITRTGFTHNHNVNLSGGMGSTVYSADITYRQENGIVKRTDNNNINVNFNLTQYMLNDLVKMQVNFVKGIHKNSASNASNGDLSNIYRQAVIRNPTSSIYNANGTYNEDFNKYQYYNPVAMINETIGEYKNEWTHLLGNITLEPIKGWQTNLMLATRQSNGLNTSYRTKDYYSSIVSKRNGEAYRADNHSRSDIMEITSTYNKTIGKHRFSGLLGYGYQYDVYEGGSAWNYGFPTDVFLYNSIGLGSALKDGKASMTSTKNDSKLISFFGRISYGYDNRYNVLVSLRHEGSTKFGANYKWGNFPSVSLGWNINNEEFMKDISWLNNLKLRTGFGITGVIPSDSYMSKTRYNYGFYYYENGKWISGVEPQSNPNPNLKWETSREFNIGVDYSIFGNRVSGSVDFYNKKTSDLLWEYKVPLPPNIFSTTVANVGKIRNTGVEVALNVIPVQSKSFEWKSTLVFSHNSNKLLSLSNDLYTSANYLNTGGLGDPITLPSHRLEVGTSMGNYWGMKSVGISDKGLWMVENPETGQAEEFAANMTNDDYRQYLGNGLPKIILGWNNSFTYKNFDLNVQVSGQFGFKILNEQRMFYENTSIAYNMLRSANDKVYGKRVLSSSQPQTFVSYYLENGNYAKLDNVTLGYTFNVEKINFIKHLRVFVAGQNLLCLTGYSGLDPEITNNDWRSAGNDPRDKYPTIRSFTFGVNVTF